MNGYSEQPSLNLPPVGGEQSPNRNEGATRPNGAENAPSYEAGQSSPPPILPDFPSTQPPADNTAAIPIQSAPVPQATVVSQAPLPDAIANDDQDLIPKEWVIKAKHIIERTKEDPYSQNREFTKFKASYIKDRYGMTLKVDNE